MRHVSTLITLAALAGCASTPADPELARQEAATARFESCMASTLPTFGPITVATSEQRLKAAEICKDVMKDQ